MDASSMRAHLQALCDDLDSTRSASRSVTWAGLALVTGGVLVSCVAYGAPFESGGAESVCDDDVDNDNDGLMDCSDDDCVDDPACEAGDEYGAPDTEDDCTDGEDDDGDGLTDCDDEDCVDDPACENAGAYAAPSM